MAVEVLPLTKSRWDDLVDLFGQRGSGEVERRRGRPIVRKAIRKRSGTSR